MLPQHLQLCQINVTTVCDFQIFQPCVKQRHKPKNKQINKAILFEKKVKKHLRLNPVKHLLDRITASLSPQSVFLSLYHIYLEFMKQQHRLSLCVMKALPVSRGHRSSSCLHRKHHRSAFLPCFSNSGAFQHAMEAGITAPSFKAVVIKQITRASSAAPPGARILWLLLEACLSCSPPLFLRKNTLNDEFLDERCVLDKRFEA